MFVKDESSLEQFSRTYYHFADLDRKLLLVVVLN